MNLYAWQTITNRLSRLNKSDPGFRNECLYLNVYIACSTPLNPGEVRRSSSKIAGKTVTTYENGRAGTAWASNVTQDISGCIHLVKKLLPGCEIEIQHGLGETVASVRQPPGQRSRGSIQKDDGDYTICAALLMAAFHMIIRQRQ